MVCGPDERTTIIITHDNEPYRDAHGNEIELGSRLRFLDSMREAVVVMWNDDVYVDFGEYKFLFSFYVWLHDEYEVVG